MKVCNFKQKAKAFYHPKSGATSIAPNSIMGKKLTSMMGWSIGLLLLKATERTLLWYPEEVSFFDNLL